jgi:hypothetical protein
MRGAVAMAALLVAPGCGGGDKSAAGDPLRRASYRSLAARDFLATCPAGAGRAETQRQLERLAELNRFAGERGALRALQLAGNDWAAIGRHDPRPPCAPGEAAYRGALAEFSARLDDLAAAIGEHRP